MHNTAFEFVRRMVQSLPPLRSVVEFGSRVVNGSVREIFTDALDYVGVDLADGPGVDVVADVADWCGNGFDCVVCCEVLEHTPRVAHVLLSAYNALRRGGVFIMTCATNPRNRHSAEGGGLVAGEYYENVDVQMFSEMAREAGFDMVLIDPISAPGDLHAIALRVR